MRSANIAGKEKYMKKICIIKTGDTFPEIAQSLKNFEDWIITGLNVDPKLTRVIDAANNDPLPRPDQCKGAVIAGSHAMVTQDLDWSLAIENWVPDLVQKAIPVLGICYGHQLLAKAFGGKVDYHPKGIEIGTTRIECMRTGYLDPLFKGLPEHVDVHVCHSQSVVRMPRDAVLIAGNSFEPHHAFKIGPFAWGLQFHPEYDETIMKAYAAHMESEIQSSGGTLKAVLDGVRPTPMAAKILERFGKLVS